MSHPHRRAFWKSLTLAALLAGTGGPSAQAITYETIARTDDAAPGTGGQFLGFDPPLINIYGETAFLATLRLGVGGVGSLNDRGVWSTAYDRFDSVAMKGDETGDFDDGFGVPIFDSFSSLAFNNNGDTAFFVKLRSGVASVTTANDAALYAQQGADPVRIAREGAAPPSSNDGVVFGTFSGLLFGNDDSITAFKTTLGGLTSGHNFGLWSETLGPLDLAVLHGDKAPVHSGGAPPFLLAPFFSVIDPPVMDSAGGLVFTAILSVSTDGIDATNDHGIWRYDGVLTVVMQENDLTGTELPGKTGSRFGNFTIVRPNPAGDIAFIGGSKPNVGGVTTSNDRGVWIAPAAGRFVLVAREGDAAPGTPTGAVFADFSALTFIDTAPHGRVAVIASLKTTSGGVTTATDTGIWAQDGLSAMQLVAREGSAAAGTGTGVVFGTFSGLSENVSGHLGFAATLTGTDVTTANDAGLWGQNAAGELKLVARKGAAFLVAPGITRTIATLGFIGGSGGGDGLSDGWTDAERMAFSATFTDGTSGIFIASLSTGYAAWAETRTPPVTGGPLADDDHDGRSNGIEYAFDTDPNTPDVALVLPPPALVGEALTVNFAQRSTVRDVVYRAESSEDLVTWTPIPDAGTGLTHTFTVSTVGQPKLYFRYKIDVAP